MGNQHKAAGSITEDEVWIFKWKETGSGTAVAISLESQCARGGHDSLAMVREKTSLLISAYSLRRKDCTPYSGWKRLPR